MPLKRIFNFLGIFGIIFSFFFVQLMAQTAEEYLKAAQKAFSEERHDSALESIKRAIALNPEELDYRYLMALILVRQEKLQAGAEILNSLLLVDEIGFGKAYFDLAGVYRKQEKFKEAITTLENAEIVDRERALLQQGFAYLDEGKMNKAIEIFLEVKNFPRFEQNACYNLGIAYHRKMDYKKALAFAEEAIEIAPETRTAQNARFLIDAIKREMKLKSRFWLFASSTGQYDSNIILQPLEQAGFQNNGISPSKKDDYATKITIKGEYKPIMKRNWELTLESTYLQYLYAQLKTNDLIAIMPGARLNLSSFPFFFRLSYNFGRFLVNTKPYAHVHSFSPVLTLVEGRYARSEVMLETIMRRYLDGITPDADHYMVGIRQFFVISKMGEAQVGYKFEVEDNKEDKGDFISHEFILGWTTPFILKTYLSASYSYLIRDFEFTEVLSPDQRRKDHEHLIFVFLNRRFGRHVELNLFYNHTLNDSNIAYFIADFGNFDPYHWRKNVVSLSLSLIF